MGVLCAFEGVTLHTLRRLTLRLPFTSAARAAADRATNARDENESQEERHTREPGSSTGLQVEWPEGEPVTVWKVYALHKKIGLYTGTVVGAQSLYGKRVHPLLCRTKLVAKVDNAKRIQELFSPGEYGIHRSATLGDLREPIRDVAVLLGFQIMEEDRSP